MYQLHRVYVKGVMSCVSTSILRYDGWSSELSNVNKNRLTFLFLGSTVVAYHLKVKLFLDKIHALDFYFHLIA